MEPLAPARHIAGARHRTSPPALRARPSNDTRFAGGGLELAHLDLPTHEDPARKGIEDVVLLLYGGGCTDCRRSKVDGVPSLKELMDFLVARNGRISVCEPSGRALGVTEEDFAGKNSGFGTSMDAAKAYVGYDRVAMF